MKYSASKEVNRLVRDLVRAGWSFQRGGKHARLYPPYSTKFLTIPTSPSDIRSRSNLKAQARRLVA